MKSLTQFIQEACKGNNCKNKKNLQDILNNKKRLKEINDILGESLEEINESNSQNDIDKFKLWIDAQLSYQTEEDEDIWIFGYPLFASYMMEFDFDRKVVGFNGKVAPLNLTVEWEEWDKETKKFSFTKILENRNVMIIGIVCISIVLLIIIALVIKCIVSRKKGNEQHGPLVEN